MRFARDHGMRVAAQGTGHNASAIASLDNTVLLRTLRMRGVEIDPRARRTRVAAGTWWGEVTPPAAEHGLAALAGTAADVGVVGYSLGGGLGWLVDPSGSSACNCAAIFRPASASRSTCGEGRAQRALSLRLRP